MATRCSSSSDHNEVVELFSEKSMEIIVSGTATPVCRPAHDKQHVSSAAMAERQVDRQRTDLVARSERSEHAAGVKTMPAVVAASSSPGEQAVPAQQLSRLEAPRITFEVGRQQTNRSLRRLPKAGDCTFQVVSRCYFAL